MNYLTALYRRNNFNQPTFWEAYAKNGVIVVEHGIVGKKIITDTFSCSRNIQDDIQSRYNAKRKVGYKLLSELKDNITLPVEGELLSYLNKYLPDYRTTENGDLLPMLAKTYDNTNNKLFKKVPTYIGQWKINGLRCFISAKRSNNNLFKTIELQFQSREGIIWNSLKSLEEKLLIIINEDFLNKMVDEHYILDGELYLPGYSVNEINHFVKDPTCKENGLLQFWCYDLAIDNTSQSTRLNILYNYFYNFVDNFNSKTEHLNNIRQFILLPKTYISDSDFSIKLRDTYIELGFEGLILRNPDAEYQFGKRNLSMIKYKRSTDGKFKIIDIYPEGIKRNNIPLFLCKNDINDSTFEVHVNGSHEYQENILKNKEQYIGKYMYIEYGERSGCNEVPFHCKTCNII